jgi:hypothetical protein
LTRTKILDIEYQLGKGGRWLKRLNKEKIFTKSFNQGG